MRAPRGAIASTERASPARSSPARAMARKRSMYQCECPGSAETFCIQMLCSTMPALSPCVQAAVLLAALQSFEDENRDLPFRPRLQLGVDGVGVDRRLPPLVVFGAGDFACRHLEDLVAVLHSHIRVGLH